jgi:hypothetical protein
MRPLRKVPAFPRGLLPPHKPNMQKANQSAPDYVRASGSEIMDVPKGPDFILSSTDRPISGRPLETEINEIIVR